jgi:outer membrane lipoprotein-sorting protein
MSRMILAVCMAVTLCLLFVTGCAKKSQPPAKPQAQTQEQTKTEAEYKAEAQKEITQENANQELDKLEKSINEEAVEEQQ